MKIFILSKRYGTDLENPQVFTTLVKAQEEMGIQYKNIKSKKKNDSYIDALSAQAVDEYSEYIEWMITECEV